jgi:putative heme transporter
MAATCEDLPVGSLDVGALARRAAVPAALAGAAALVLILGGGPMKTFADALDRAIHADPRWVGAGALFELLSFGGYVALLALVGGRATRRLGLRQSAEVTLGGAAATRLLPTAGVGGAALTLWALRRTGLAPRVAARTLLTFLVLLYAVFLGAIVVAGALIAAGTAGVAGPRAVALVPAAGALLVVVAALAAAAWAPLEPAAGRLRAGAGLLGAATREAIAHVRAADLRLLGAPAWWAFDLAVLWAMLAALGAPPPAAVVVLGYFVGQVGNTIPVPGAVSGGMVGVLVAFGVEPDHALASVLAYRAVAIWLPAPIGLVALGGLRRTTARWAREDEARLGAEGLVAA